MAGYPKHTRRKFFAMKYIRLLLDKRIIEKLGHSVFALLVQVVIREDHLKYAPVNFSNDDLRDRIGVSKEDTMARARDRAVQEGWLFYRPAPVGSRRSGT